MNRTAGIIISKPFYHFQYFPFWKHLAILKYQISGFPNIHPSNPFPIEA
jgi:hypothetical protein